MQFDQVIKKRHSVKSFKKRKAPWDKVLEAIDAATKGPFSGNIQNLKYIIIEDTGKIKELTEHSHQSFINQAGLVLVICSDDTYLENHYGERGRIYNRQQAGAAIQTVLLKLVDLGLSACWVGAFTDELIRNYLDIPSHIQVEAIIPIGYEKPERFKSKKKKQHLENVIFWEKWDQDKRPTLFQEPE